MRKTLLTAALCLLVPVFAKAQEADVLTSQLSIWDSPQPDSQMVETVDRGARLQLEALYRYWGLGRNGWFGVDYTDFRFPKLKETGRIELQLCELTEPVGGYEPGAVGVVAAEGKDQVAVAFKDKVFTLNKNACRLIQKEFNVEVVNLPAVLYRGELEIKLKPGQVVLISPNGSVFYDNYLYDSIHFPSPDESPDRETLLREINRLIDIFNNAKYSSPLADRLGYFVKTLPVRNEDLKVVNTPTGVGVFVKLKYRLYTRDGEPIDDRKTRLILKRSNFIFWKRLTEELFSLGVNKFVELDVYRFNGKGAYDDEGFVASSYHFYKEYGFPDWRAFVNLSESNLSEDLWFFADQVYERLEGSDED
jgi:hypothetical protein